MTSESRGRLSGLQYPCFLIVVALTVFAPILFGGRTLYPTDITNKLILPFAAGQPDTNVQETAISDYVLYYYPVRYFQAASFRAGHLNVWNPYVFGGHPAFANNAGVVAFDPFNLLLVWPNLSTALAWRSFLQVAACLIFMYLYLRHLNLDAAGCLVGSLGYGLNSMFWANIFDWSIGGMLWFPLVCLAIDRAIVVRSLRRMAVAGGILGIALLASPLQIYFYVCLGVGALLSLQWLVLRRDWQSLKAVVVVGTVVFVIGVGLSAIQLLPSIELYGQSARFAAGALRATSKSTRSPRDMVVATLGLGSFVFPNLAGRLKGSMMVSGALWAGETHWQGFIGVVPFFLAVLGSLASEDRRRIPYAILAMSVVVVVVYTPLSALVYERFFLVYIFCASVLAAFGYTAVCRGELLAARARFAVRSIAGFLALVIMVIGAVNIAFAVASARVIAFVEAKVSATAPSSYFGSSYPALYLQKARVFLDDLRISSPHTAVPMLIAILGLVAIASRVRGRMSARAFASLTLALTAFDLVFMTLTHVPLVDLKRYPFSPRANAIELIKNDHGLYRAISYRAASEPPVLPFGFVSTYGIQAADGYDDLGPPNLSQLVSFSPRPCGTEFCVDPSNTDLANVRYILTGRRTQLPAARFDLIYDDEMRVYRDRTTIERAFWVSSYDVVPDTASAITKARTSGFDPRTSVILDRPPELHVASDSAGAKVHIVSYHPTSVTIHIEAPSGGLVVLSDTYYPGWLAILDGHPVQILRANGVMRAVAVAPGSHDLQFLYSPTSLKLGAVVSALALCGVLASALIMRTPRT